MASLPATLKRTEEISKWVLIEKGQMHTFRSTRVFIHEVRQVIYLPVDNDPKITNAVVLGDFIFREGQLGSGCRHDGRGVDRPS